MDYGISFKKIFFLTLPIIISIQWGGEKSFKKIQKSLKFIEKFLSNHQPRERMRNQFFWDKDKKSLILTLSKKKFIQIWVSQKNFLITLSKSKGVTKDS